MKMYTKGLFFFLALIFSLLLWEDARANMAYPHQQGEFAAGPAGKLDQLALRREVLRLDLRPLAQGKKARVEVLYEIENLGEKRKVALVFVTPGIDKGEVRLDGEVLEAEKLDKEETKKVWPLPQKEEAEKNYSSFEDLEGLRFTPLLSSGLHKISVDYFLKPGSYSPRQVYRDYILSYYLAPARDWPHFGRLKVEVMAPPGWKVESAPQLKWADTRWKGEFSKIPSSWLQLTLSPPSPPAWKRALPALAPWLALALALFLSLRWTWKFLHYQRRKEMSFFSALFAFLCLALTCGVTGGILSWLGNLSTWFLFDSTHLSSQWTYGNSLRAMLIIFLTSLLSFLLPFGVVGIWKVKNSRRNSSSSSSS